MLLCKSVEIYILLTFRFLVRNFIYFRNIKKYTAKEFATYVPTITRDDYLINILMNNYIEREYIYKHIKFFLFMLSM